MPGRDERARGGALFRGLAREREEDARIYVFSRSLFEQLDRPALRPLPTERYVFAQWKKVRVNIDYQYYASYCTSLSGR